MHTKKFVEAYQVGLSQQDWSAVAPLIHDDATVTFSNGIRHEGKAVIKEAYQKNFQLIQQEQFEISNVRWDFRSETVAVYQFEYRWSGVIDGQPMQGKGFGITTIIQTEKSWELISEKLIKA